MPNCISKKCNASHTSTKRHYCKDCFDRLSLNEQTQHMQSVKQKQNNTSSQSNNPSLANIGDSSRNIDTMFGEDYWERLNEILDAKVNRLETKLDGAIDELNRKITVLESKCEKYEDDISTLKSIVIAQQKVLQKSDSAERECNIIISGLSEEEITEGDDTYVNDEEKLDVIFTKLDIQVVDTEPINRLGKPSANYCRKIKMKLPNKETKNLVLKKAAQLKNANSPWKNVYIQSDKHHVLLQEEKRLRDKKKDISKLDENRGKEIFIRKGKLTVDGVLVDQNLFFA